MFLKKAVESLFQGINGKLSEAERLICELLTTILEASAVWTNQDAMRLRHRKASSRLDVS